MSPKKKKHFFLNQHSSHPRLSRSLVCNNFVCCGVSLARRHLQIVSHNLFFFLSHPCPVQQDKLIQRLGTSSKKSTWTPTLQTKLLTASTKMTEDKFRCWKTPFIKFLRSAVAGIMYNADKLSNLYSFHSELFFFLYGTAQG